MRVKFNEMWWMTEERKNEGQGERESVSRTRLVVIGWGGGAAGNVPSVATPTPSRQWHSNMHMKRIYFLKHQWNITDLVF